jgi:hypothetical protein
MLPKDIEAKYEIRGTLGAGAMGTVYDAQDRIIERRVAIKVVKRPPAGDPEGEESHARFRREAQAAGRLSHPNIVGVYDYGENEETAWIVMELVEGGSLKQRIDRQERFTIPDIVRVMDQVLAALAYSHGRGVVHRDIKPGNVMLTADGSVKLADFGIARLENSSMTQVGTVIGTPSYMAPEQLRGETVDARADIWAAGVMLYQLLTGEKPFDGGFSAVMHKALHTEPPPPSQLSVTAPRAFDAVVAKALAKRPEDRFASAKAFADAIRAAASPAEAEAGFRGGGSLPGLDTDATLVHAAPAAPRPAPAPVPPSGAPARKAPIGLILGGGGALAAAAVAAWFFLGQGSAPPEPAQQRQEQLRQEAEQRARQEAERLRRQAAQQPTESPAPPSPPGPDLATQQAAAEAERLRQQQAAAEAERQRQQQAAAAETERQRQQQAAAAETERQRQQQTAATETDRQRQQRAAAEAERQRQQQASIAAAAEAERQRQAQAQAQAQQDAQLRLRAEIQAAAATATRAEPCSLVTASVADDRATLAGIVRRGGEVAMRQALTARGIPPEAVIFNLQSFDGPYCEVLDAIRAIAATAPGAPPRAQVLGALPLAKGELLRMTVEMPDFPAQLYLSYLMKSGEVAQLVASRPELARARVPLGDPGPGFPGWEVDEPFGTDLIVVFASDQPIFPQRRPQVEKQSDYLAALAARLRALEQQGARVIARVLLVDTVERR